MADQDITNDGLESTDVAAVGAVDDADGGPVEVVVGGGDLDEDGGDADDM